MLHRRVRKQFGAELSARPAGETAAADTPMKRGAEARVHTDTRV